MDNKKPPSTQHLTLAMVLRESNVTAKRHINSNNRHGLKQYPTYQPHQNIAHALIQLTPTLMRLTIVVIAMIGYIIHPNPIWVTFVGFAYGREVLPKVPHILPILKKLLIEISQQSDTQ